MKAWLPNWDQTCLKIINTTNVSIILLGSRKRTDIIPNGSLRKEMIVLPNASDLIINLVINGTNLLARTFNAFSK